jgi:hypothetical protein
METERDASDRTTSELLSVVLGVTDVTAADLDRIALAIDSGQLARAALAPDQPWGLSELPPAVADVLTAVFDIARRSALAAPPVAIRGPADVALIARRELGGRARECVLTIVCDATNRVLRTVIVTRGSAELRPALRRACVRDRSQPPRRRPRTERSGCHGDRAGRGRRTCGRPAIPWPRLDGRRDELRDSPELAVQDRLSQGIYSRGRAR